MYLYCTEKLTFFTNIKLKVILTLLGLVNRYCRLWFEGTIVSGHLNFIKKKTFKLLKYFFKYFKRKRKRREIKRGENYDLIWNVKFRAG